MHELRTRYQVMTGRREQVAADASVARAAHEGAASEAQLLGDVIEVLELAGSHARDIIRREVGGLMTAAMQDTFGPDSGAEVEFQATTRGYQAQIITRTPEFRGNPMRTDGGSACRVLSVALRAAFVRRLRGLPQILLLDEPFPGVDRSRLEQTVGWLKALSEQLGMQILVVSHEWPEVWEEHADKIINIEHWDKALSTGGEDTPA